MVLYDDDRFGAAESTLLRLGSGAAKALPSELLLLSKAQVSQSVSQSLGMLYLCILPSRLSRTTRLGTPPNGSKGPF